MNSSSPDKIVLFEIPIYSMDEESYKKKWDKKIAKEANENFQISSNRSYEDCVLGLLNNLGYRKKIYSWKYNQIIGYITVNIVGNSKISFDVYKPDNRKQFCYTVPMRDWICNQLATGNHFLIDERKSNHELITEIKEWVSAMIEIHVVSAELRVKKDRLYADTSLFEATIDSVDIFKLIKVRRLQREKHDA